MILCYDKTGIPVAVGDKTVDFRGDPVEVLAILPPRHSGSTGRVTLKSGNWTHDYYPGVIAATWIEK
jgi:hypothetical protein